MTDDSLIGKQLANFQIESVLGRGGMGMIYVGKDVKLERPVAIKVIDTRFRANPSYAERFVRESRAVATWRHENIVQIYYADDSDGLYYFVMEYIKGRDLGHVLARYSASHSLLSQSAVLQIGKALASALDYAHAKGVIHRDVKPSNVMVADDQRVVLMDFGLALDTQAGSLGEVFGTSHYIAPEQARKSADAVPQSDLYALGVMLYEMLTGSVPFDDPSATSVALQHITQPPPPPRTLNPNLSEEVEKVLLKALSKAPADRYQSGAELMAALEEALGSSPQPAKAAGDSSQPAAAPLAPDPSTPPPFNPDENLIGQQLDSYQIETLLGRGGMANIYRGVDVRLKRTVAIKVIDTPFRSDSDYAARFYREAQTIAQLEHPNIVRLYQYGDANGLLYIVMEYIEGNDLHKVLGDIQQDSSEWTPRRLGKLVREVCAALDYAHAKGVIHRDVKPSNIMLDKHGRTVLADFGLALLTEAGTRGEIFGSPHYVAPEQAISSAKVVPQSDLYSLGVILYQMWTGRVPFDDADPLAIAMLHMTETPRPPSEHRATITPQLEAVILKTLAKDPAERYPNGAALADALDAALGISGSERDSSSQPIPLPPPPAVAINAPATASRPDAPTQARPPSRPLSIPAAPAPSQPSQPSQLAQPAPTAPAAATPVLPLPPMPAAVASQAQPSQPPPTSGSPAAPTNGSILQRPSEPLPSAAPPPALVAQERAPTQPVSPLKRSRAPRRTIVPLLIGLIIIALLGLTALLIFRSDLFF
ncbi:MAG TPA: protein kinase [Herpetosiphonaceae bacterium]|nr:protein kinase [Herpetosiphonaceae bacterium]